MKITANIRKMMKQFSWVFVFSLELELTSLLNLSRFIRKKNNEIGLEKDNDTSSS